MSVEALAYVKTLELGERESSGTRIVLYVIGENTFNDTFRCKLGQEQIAFEAGRISERTLRRHLHCLAGAQFDEDGKIVRHSNGSKILIDPIIVLHPSVDKLGRRSENEIEIVGFAPWYLDRTKARKSKQRVAEPPVKLSGGSTGQNDRSTGQSYDRGTGHQLAGSYKESRTNPVLSEEVRPSALEDSISDFQVKVGAWLKTELGDKVFESWFANVRFSIVDMVARVEAPQPFVRKWILEHYGDLVRRVCKGADAGISDVNFTVRATNDNVQSPAGKVG